MIMQSFRYHAFEPDAEVSGISAQAFASCIVRKEIESILIDRSGKLVQLFRVVAMISIQKSHDAAIGPDMTQPGQAGTSVSSLGFHYNLGSGLRGNPSGIILATVVDYDDLVAKLRRDLLDHPANGLFLVKGGNDNRGWIRHKGVEFFPCVW